MESQKCPECGAVNHPKGVNNTIREFRCNSCGMVYYVPEECRTDPKEEDTAQWTKQAEKMQLPSEGD